MGGYDDGMTNTSTSITRRLSLRPISEEIAGLAAVTGGNPMRRGDYRRPLRANMLTDARRALLVAAGAPGHVVDVWGGVARSEWPAKLHENVAGC